MRDNSVERLTLGMYNWDSVLGAEHPFFFSLRHHIQNECDSPRLLSDLYRFPGIKAAEAKAVSSYPVTKTRNSRSGSAPTLAH
jgi:hypothetical protein